MIGSRVAISLIFVFILSSITSIISDDVINHEGIKIIHKDLSTPVKTSEKQLPKWAGFIGCIVASVFFGSNLLPVKQFSVGDGFFFQFIYCIGIWLVGFILNLILDNQRFYPLVLIGGTK